MKQVLLKIVKLPFYLFAIVLMMPAILCLLFWDLLRRGDRAQTKPLVRIGFDRQRRKENGRAYWLFTRDDCEIRLFPDEACLIRLPGERELIPLERSALLNAEEQAELEKIVQAFQTCDYRDRDAFSPTTHYVAYLTNHL